MRPFQWWIARAFSALSARQEDAAKAISAIHQMLWDKQAVGQDDEPLATTAIPGWQTMLIEAVANHASVRLTTMNPTTHMTKRLGFTGQGQR